MNKTSVVRAVLFCVLGVGLAAPASAQLDPLLFLKNTKPNVLLVVDTANRMQRDGNNNYYDEFVYTSTGAGWEATIGVTTQLYRRKYTNLIFGDNLSNNKFQTDKIVVVPTVAGDTSFDALTKLGVARFSLIRAIQLNQTSVRFGLLKMRQASPTLGTQGNDGLVWDGDLGQQSPTDAAIDGRWKITRPTSATGMSNSSQTTVTSPLVKPDAAAQNTQVLAILAKSPRDAGALLPEGADALNAVDAPVKYMLDDAKAEATRLIGLDTNGCRNTVVVLVVGGGEGTLSAQDAAAAATTFKNIGGRRVPIYVVAIAPPSADVAQLQAIAANSGGQYFAITKEMMAAVGPGVAVPEFVRAVNTAVQHAFASPADVNTPPTVALPFGPSTEYQVGSPIVGTVNLANAKAMDGTSLANTQLTLSNGNLIPQRSNVLLTTAFAVPGPVTTPGFPGRLRAFRLYRPEPDTTKIAGYKFVGDGTALWVARTPTALEGTRNIYTALPSGTVVEFTDANATTLQPYLNDSDAAGLINYVRGLPLGAFVDSTPAFLDPPSLDPPPDADYPAFATANKGRRALIFIGGNDGMMHAIDARSGVEVWAFIPFNLLPKLRALREGLSVDSFHFFVDGSPKIADVKTTAGWRTYVIFGEGPGGTFYQTFDVTLPGMASYVSSDSDNVGAVLAFFGTSNLAPEFKWSFPSYSSFDYTLSTTVTPYGDIKATATAAEKSVGQTWSDPAVGEIQDAKGDYVVLAGSGFLPYSQQQQVNRGGTAAGTTFYVINATDGLLLDSRDVGNDGVAEDVDNCSAAGNCTSIKNALQSDPVATGAQNSRFITLAYVGDLDGRVWRFGLGTSSDRARITSGPGKLFEAGQPIFSSMAIVNVGGTQQYVFFGTGSDLLPSTGVLQAYKLVGVLDQNGTGTQAFAQALSAVGSPNEEKVSAYPAVAGDIVFFTTTTYHPGAPCTPPDANIYALTFIGGAAYDNTGDDQVTKKDTPKVKTMIGAGRATAPFVADQHLLIAVGGKLEVFGDPQDFNNGVGQVGVRILSWREIR